MIAVMGGTRSKRFKWLIVVLYIVVLCLLATGTLAWFIFDKTATIENQGDLQIVAGSRLDISIDDGANWGNNFPVEIENASYPDITGNGSSFLCPMFLDADDNVFSDDPNTFRIVSPANESSYCISLRIKFRTTANTEVYLSNESYVNPKNLTPSDQNRSIYGNISRDAIAGAVRVGFAEEVVNEHGVVVEQVKNIWIPNDKYNLYYDSNGYAQLGLQGPREESYGYQYLKDGKIESYTFTDEDYYSRNVTVGGPEVLASPTEGVGATAMINQAQSLLSFSSVLDENGKSIQEKTLIVRIWIEGTDREAEKALVGGEMSYKLHFICIDKNENSNNDKIDSLELNNKTLSIPDETESLSDRLEYSTNGIDWTLYKENVNYTNDDEYLYVRFVETTSDKASNVKVIQLKVPIDTGE